MRVSKGALSASAALCATALLAADHLHAQAPARCAVTINTGFDGGFPTTFYYPRTDGGHIAFDTNPPACAWTAVSSAPWIWVGPAAGSGSAMLGFGVMLNTTGAPRTGTITIGDQTIAITQYGANLAALHDLTGDGRSDLLIRDAIGDLDVLQVNAGLSAQRTGSFWTVDPAWQLVGAGDLDGDGYADLVWQHSSGALAVWFMLNATIKSTSPLLLNGSPVSVGASGWQVRGVGDVDGDSHADLIWQNSVNGGLAVWSMNAQVVTDTTLMMFNGSPVTMPDPNWVIAGAGDLNRDGRADLVWQNQSTGGLGAWTMNGSAVQIMRSLTPGSVPVDYRIGAVGDLEGDGVADIVWIKQSTGELFVWTMEGFAASHYQGPLWIPGTGSTYTLPAGWTLVGGK